MKKFAFLGLALLGAATMSLAACGNDNTTINPNVPDTNFQTEAGTYYGVTSSEAIYGVAAITSAKLLSTTSDVKTATADNLSSKALSEAEEFNKYFNMLDCFFDKQNTKTVVEPNTSDVEAVKNYDYKLTVTGKNAQGGDVVHTLYFSETQGIPNHTSYRDDDETVTVDSVTYSVNGVVDMGERDGETVYYYTEGLRVEQVICETEGKKSEIENLSSIDLKSYEDPQNKSSYVQLINTHSSEEEQGEIESEDIYTYSVFEGGRLVESTEVGFETESEFGKQESEYSVKFIQGGKRGYYEIEREILNGATVIEVEYKIDGERGKFSIVKQGENYRYQFGSDPSSFFDFKDFDD